MMSCWQVRCLEGIMHSLLGGFQSSFNKPAVIWLHKLPQNREQHCCLPSVCNMTLCNLYRNETQAPKMKKCRLWEQLLMLEVARQWNLRQLCRTGCKDEDLRKKTKKGKKTGGCSGELNPRGQQKENDSF